MKTGLAPPSASARGVACEQALDLVDGHCHVILCDFLAEDALHRVAVGLPQYAKRLG